jgi:hypothetical protein
MSKYAQINEEYDMEHSRKPKIEYLFLLWERRDDGEWAVTELTRKPCVPRVVCGVVWPKLRRPFGVGQDFPEWAVFEHGRNNQLGAA